MGKYDEKHSSEWVGPFPLVRVTEIENKDTGEKGKGYGWTREEANRDAFKTLKSADKNDPDYTPGSSDSGSGSSGGGSICYLTTACVQAMNLPDDCLELNVLRNFRDKILMSQPLGRRAVKEYYKIAPEIVQAIEEREDAQGIWQATYRDIRHAVSLVLSGDFEGAFKHYQRMTSKLKLAYLDK